ncbi:MAG: PHP domain-containing protein [Bacteroidota bacterium]|nr:PHP domain-containing protein [Bacteroidota bacterium]
MKMFKADLHIHTCLSPCGNLDMSPRNIVNQAIENGLDMIAITDHNSTHNVKTCMELAENTDLFVIPGCEMTSEEEVHCLGYFPDINSLDVFQSYLDSHLTDIENNPEKFGFQVAVDKFDTINYEESRLLVAALKQPLEAIAEQVISLGGIFVPAHIDKTKNSVISQLGFLPYGLNYNALELSPNTCLSTYKSIRPELASHLFIQSSDAHFLNDIAKVHTKFYMETLDWENFADSFREDSNNYFEMND